MPFVLFLRAFGERGVGSDSVFTPTWPSSEDSDLVLTDDLLGLGDCDFGLFAGEALWAEGQLCWFRHTEHRGLTGKHTCWPKPTSSQLISLHSSLGKGKKKQVTHCGTCLHPMFRSFWSRNIVETQADVFFSNTYLDRLQIKSTAALCCSECHRAADLGSHSSRALRVSSGFLAGFLSQPRRPEMRCTCVSTPAGRKGRSMCAV